MFLIYKPICFLPLIMAITSCAIKTAPKAIYDSQVKLRGYTTGCEGKLLIIDPTNAEASSTRIAKPGPLEIKIFYESPAMLTTQEAFHCFDNSEHIVTFDAKPNKHYRFYAEKIAAKLYKITAFEYLNPRLPEAKPVATVSKQLKIYKRCGFDPSSPSCEALRAP